MTTQTETAWPEGVIARYLTVGGATVDITYTRTEDLRAVCTGERCPWVEREFPETYYYDTAEAVAQKVADALPPLQRKAQAHAEKCRAMPKPIA